LSDLAIERYREVLKRRPDEPISANNLAYSLATRRNAPKEALPFAQRAVAAAPQNPGFLDTLAWIEHLLGDHGHASDHIAAAVRGAPQNPGIRLHAAVVYLGADKKDAAQVELQEALKINPELGKSEVDKDLRARLGIEPR